MNDGTRHTGLIRRLEDAPAYARALLLTALVSALTLAAYSNSFHAGFHLDDGHQITANHYIRHLSNIPKFFTDGGVNTALSGVDFYRPVTTASFAVNYALNELSLPGYHIFNLTLHILNALLVFVIVSAVLSRPGYRGGFVVPLAVSMLFALHPIEVSAVTYISARAVLLAAFFSLSSLYAFMRYRGSARPAAYFWGALSPLLFLLGMLSKGMAVGILGVMLAYDLILRSGNDNRSGRSWLYYLCYVPCLALFALGWSLVGHKNSIEIIHYGTWEYLMSQAKALLMYVRLLFLPVNQNADYVLPATSSLDVKVAVSALLLAAVLYGLYRIRKEMPAESFFGFWFIIALLPESSFLPILDIAVEYRLYMPSVGFISLMALLAIRAVRSPAVTIAAFAAVLAMFGTLTYCRNRVYFDNISYWGDIQTKSPHSGRAARAYGDSLVVAGRYEEAIPVLKRALPMDAPFNEPEKVLSNLGRCYYHLGRLDEAEESFRQAIKASPGFLPAYGSLGSLYYETGKFERASDVFAEQARISSGNPKAEYNLGVSLMMLGRTGKAILHLLDAVEYGLDNFDVHYNLAVLYERNGQPVKARNEAEKAMGLAVDENERYEAAVVISRLES